MQSLTCSFIDSRFHKTTCPDGRSVSTSVDSQCDRFAMDNLRFLHAVFKDLKSTWFVLIDAEPSDHAKLAILYLVNKSVVYCLPWIEIFRSIYVFLNFFNRFSNSLRQYFHLGEES
jgi:hypothetical protein